MLSIGFIGSGNIAQAIIKGWRGNDEINQLVYSKNNGAKVAEELGIASRISILELWQDSDIVLLAVPKSALSEIQAQLNMAAMVKPSVIVTSLIDGVSLAELQDIFGDQTIISRAVPNINVSTRSGYTGLSFPEGIDEEIRGAIAMLFLELGRVDEFTEEQLPAVSAIASAGPAYVAALADILANTALENGIDVQRAVSMAEQTFYGTATTMRQLQQSPNSIEVAASPADGGTEAALEHLAEGGFVELLKDAIAVAQDKSTPEK